MLTFFGTLGAFSDSRITPNIIIETNSKSFENSTQVKVDIRNDGLEPARSLRITINPEYDIIKFRPIFYTEKIDLKLNGPQSLIGTMDRLANGQNIVLEVVLNSTNKIDNFLVVVNHDKGSTRYNIDDTSEIGQITISLLTSLLSASVAMIIAQVIRKTFFSRKIKITKWDCPSTIKKEQEFVVSAKVKGTIKNGFLDFMIKESQTKRYWFPDPAKYDMSKDRGTLTLNNKTYENEWKIIIPKTAKSGKYVAFMGIYEDQVTQTTYNRALIDWKEQEIEILD